MKNKAGTPVMPGKTSYGSSANVKESTAKTYSKKSNGKKGY